MKKFKNYKHPLIVLSKSEIIRDKQNKFLSDKFNIRDTEDKLVLILNNSDDFQVKRRPIIVAREHNKEWSCFFSQEIDKKKKSL